MRLTFSFASMELVVGSSVIYHLLYDCTGFFCFLDVGFGLIITSSTITSTKLRMVHCVGTPLTV